jgi:hypothetical protein
VELKKAEVAAQGGGDDLGARRLEASTAFRQVGNDVLWCQPGGVNFATREELLQELPHVPFSVCAGCPLQSHGIEQVIVEILDLAIDTVRLLRFRLRQVASILQNRHEMIDRRPNGLMLSDAAERAIAYGGML